MVIITVQKSALRMSKPGSAKNQSFGGELNRLGFATIEMNWLSPRSRRPATGEMQATIASWRINRLNKN